MEVYRRKLNREIIQQILDSFVELTGIRAAYFDTAETRYRDKEAGNKALDSDISICTAIIGKNKPLCGFCENLRVYRKLEENCVDCDRLAFKRAEETGKPYVYKCHMGLYEAVVPLFIRNRLTGYLMLGQVASTEELKPQLKELEARLQAAGVDRERTAALLTAYENTAAMSISKIEAAANMLNIIAQHIINTDMIHVYDINSIEKARHHIHLHFQEALTAAEIAEAAALSTSYLSYLFKRETGYTITNYIDKLRIDYAKELLVMTSKSAKEISFLAGYSDQNYFSRIFKKHEGISPMEFRTKNKKSY